MWESTVPWGLPHSRSMPDTACLAHSAQWFEILGLCAGGCAAVGSPLVSGPWVCLVFPLLPDLGMLVAWLLVVVDPAFFFLLSLDVVSERALSLVVRPCRPVFSESIRGWLGCHNCLVLVSCWACAGLMLGLRWVMSLDSSMAGDNAIIYARRVRASFGTFRPGTVYRAVQRCAQRMVAGFWKRGCILWR
jgi:hypothetical protein